MRSLRLPTIALLLTLALTACGSKTTITPDKSASEKIQEYNRITNKNNALNPAHGKMTHLWYGAMAGVGDTSANGVGFLRQFEDKAFTGVINLNILPRTDGKKLMVWMTRENGADAVLVGELTSIVGDARHSMAFDVTDDLSGHTNVLVTLETSTKPVNPGTVAATGTLKEVERKSK